MKIKELLLAALALAVAFSCNREKGALQEEQNSDWNTRYMGFSISTPLLLPRRRLRILGLRRYVQGLQ